MMIMIMMVVNLRRRNNQMSFQNYKKFHAVVKEIMYYTIVQRLGYDNEQSHSTR